MSIEVKITIVVGGVIDCEVAYELSRNSGKDIIVIEKSS
ncbi:hypothetical protein ES703_45782 [subsurface metagenome]